MSLGHGVTGLLLAGGRATRMGGQDKGLIDLAGRPLAAHVLTALRPQVDTVLINANRHGDEYAALGAAVVPDPLGGFLGPLAGVLAGLENASGGLVATLPCDSPFIPADYVARMRAALDAADGEIAVATDGERRQPVFMLLRTELAADLRAWLEQGGRKIDAWYEGHRVVDADFSDVPDTFININTPEERDAAAERLAGAGDNP
jgi:molybdopterin-guanine dinucleotide biosynthesis protein A